MTGRVLTGRRTTGATEERQSSVASMEIQGINRLNLRTQEV